MSWAKALQDMSESCAKQSQKDEDTTKEFPDNTVSGQSWRTLRMHACPPGYLNICTVMRQATNQGSTYSYTGDNSDISEIQARFTTYPRKQSTLQCQQSCMPPTETILGQEARSLSQKLYIFNTRTILECDGR